MTMARRSYRSRSLHSTAVMLYGLCILSAVLLPSCLPQQAEKTVPECPVPEQNCRPGAWNGAAYEGIPSYGTPGLFHRLDHVRRVNSPDNEVAITFADGQVFATVGGADLQTLHSATAVAAQEVRLTSQMYFQELAMAGALTSRSGVAVMAGRATGAQTGDADLYTCTIAGNTVRNPVRIGPPVSLPSVWDSHPALSPQADVLFFASDRPGGYGGTDLWYSTRTGSGWSEPRNCGAAVNTACDELTPFVTADGGTLLFASSGHETAGGYDLFVAAIPREFYTAIRSQSPTAALGRALNIGTPINTAADELFPCAPARFDTLLYFASNRRAPDEVEPMQQGGFDLYVLHTVQPSLASGDQPQNKPTDTGTTTRERRNGGTIRERQTDEQQQKTPDTTAEHRTVRGRVTESGTRKPVQGARITVREVPEQTVVDRTHTDSNGRFAVQVPVERDVEISAQGKQLFYDTERLRVERGSADPVELRELALPGDLSLRINFPNDEYSTPYPFLLDSNGVPTTQTWQEALDLLAENLKLYTANIRRLILVGHTDDVASDAYNKALGLRRARFVISELVQRGVPASMMEAQSAGEQRLLPRRSGEPLEQYRARCRRVDLQKEMSFILPGTD